MENIELALMCALRTKEQTRLNAHQRKQFRTKAQELKLLVTKLSGRFPSSRMKVIEEGVRRLTRQDPIATPAPSSPLYNVVD